MSVCNLSIQLISPCGVFTYLSQNAMQQQLLIYVNQPSIETQFTRGKMLVLHTSCSGRTNTFLVLWQPQVDPNNSHIISVRNPTPSWTFILRIQSPNSYICSIFNVIMTSKWIAVLQSHMYGRTNLSKSWGWHGDFDKCRPHPSLRKIISSFTYISNYPIKDYCSTKNGQSNSVILYDAIELSLIFKMNSLNGYNRNNIRNNFRE